MMCIINGDILNSYQNFSLKQQSMLPNNLSKSKQVKKLDGLQPGRQKKILSKEPGRSSTSKQKGKLSQIKSDNRLKVKQQFQTDNKSKNKQKNPQNRMILQQYYISHQKKQKADPTHFSRQNKKMKSDPHSLDTQKILYKNLEQEQKYQRNQSALEKFREIKLPKLQSYITFEGKIVNVPPKNDLSKVYRNYTSLSLYQDTNNSPAGINQRIEEKKRSIKRKNNIMRQSESQKKRRNKQRHSHSQQIVHSQKTVDKNMKNSGKESLLVEQTQNTPVKNLYQRNQRFDFKQISQLIEEDIKACNQIIIKSEHKRLRKQCIMFMSQISGEIRLRRETFYLSISIFDRTITSKLDIENYQLLSLVCLNLAMKLQQAKLAQQFFYVLGVVNSGKQSYFESVSSCKSATKSNKHLRTESKYNTINIKEIEGKKISFGSVSKILKKYECLKIYKKQFLLLEEKVTIYLRFRLWRIQAIFWADLLTCLWDQHLVLNRLNADSQLLLFRCSSSLGNISYLYQMLEMAYLNEGVYFFPSIYIVISIMYLLVRITKENQDGFEFYKESLSCSTNIIFVDKTGINQIFWLFLDKLKIEMVDILSCCQFVSKFLEPCKMKKCFLSAGEGTKTERLRQLTDHSLSIHQFNPDLYLTID